MMPIRMGANEVAAGPADALYLLLCTRYNGQWWNDGDRGYGIDPADAKVWTRDAAVEQIRRGHERGEVAVPVDAFAMHFAELADRVFRIRRGRGPLVHTLKTWPEPFAAVLSGAKRAEMRRDDRGYEAGHLLLLREYQPPTPCTCEQHSPENIHTGPRLDPQDDCKVHGARYSGREVEAIITHVLRDSQFGVAPGFAMLSILLFRPKQRDRCTGITASWCPVCGDCKCERPSDFAGDMDQPNCPLHALNSTHGEDAEE